MEKERADMLDIQRKINAHGSLRAMCILSTEALKKTIAERVTQDSSLCNPSLILLDYEIVKEETEILHLLKVHPELAAVPLFFLRGEGDELVKEEYYLLGAVVVLKRPVSRTGILRIARAAWQYETARNYERIFQKQINEIETAKEIQALNVQLESRNEFLNRVFGKYFSDELLEMILRQPDGEFIGGDKREVAILVADLRGFASKSEELEPDEMIELLNTYFGSMVDVISKYSGTVIEFMGDGILAVFGAPGKNKRYKESAIAAAIAMQNEMQGVNEIYKQKFSKHDQELEMGIGVHCGEAFVGNVGSEKMMRYNVIGRVVNECSRIEGCSTGGQVLASADILEGLCCEVTVANRAQIAAKGISKRIHICEVTNILGDYNCRLETNSKEEMLPIKKDVLLALYPIRNKVVSQKPILVRPSEFDMHKAIVVVLENLGREIKTDIKEEELLFMDVEVRAFKEEPETAFHGVYAKIVKMDGDRWKLRFTHWNREFRKFAIDIQKGERAMTTYQGQHIITVKHISLAEMEMLSIARKQPKPICTLFWAQDGEEVRLLFCSNDKSVRALEFMDYLVEDYAMVSGDGELAQAVLSPTFLKVMMSEHFETQIDDLLKKIVELYYTNCQWIYTLEYAQVNRQEIKSYPVYMKKQGPWAYVKTTDIAGKGQKFLMKSLENESYIEREASDELYIMIGCRGEIYYIKREKFEQTYEALDKPLDIYEQMLDYLPEVRLSEENDFVSLDELAHLCRPKAANGIYATCLEQRTKVFSPHNKGEYFVGRKGDYLAVRQDDLTDIYIIQREIFHATYEKQE